MIKAKRNPKVLFSSVADGMVAYHPVDDELHHLNTVAALTVEFCDGQRSVDEIAAAVAPFLPKKNTKACVGEWIGDALVAGILTNGDNVNHAEDGRELSATELVELASRLREHGKVQTAFICQQHAVELAPNDAKALFSLGELAHIVGRRDDARDAYERYLTLEPDDAEVTHLLTALRDGPTPQRVPNQCIEQLYERFSSFYDENLYDELASEIPSRLAGMVEQAIDGARGLAVLDLGCGTGVSGERVRAHAKQLVGVDLSPEMIEKAQQRKVYDQLEVAEITAWLGQCDTTFELIIASDSFIYFGDLAQVIIPAAERLTPGGFLAFSVEAADQPPYRLADSGRYVHHSEHVRAVAQQAGLAVVQLEEAYQRMEYGEEVDGVYAVLLKP